MKSRYLAAALAALTIAAAGHAQQAPSAGVPPDASAVPPPIVALPGTPPAPAPSTSVAVVQVPPVNSAPLTIQPLPATTPTPRAAATPTTTATPTPGPAPTASPTAAPTPSPTATPPLPIATPEPSPAPPTAEPTAAPFTSTVDEAEQGGSSGWLLPLGGAVVIGGLILFLLSRRSRAGEEQYEEEVEPVAEPVEQAAPPRAAPPVALVVVPAVVPAPAPPAPGRARLDFDIRPIRAGVNLLTATLEAEVVIRNEGDAPAADIRVDLRLLSARGGEDAALVAFFDDPVARAAVPPFTLAPGESRSLTRLVTLPRGSINVVTAGNRPMFVPVAAVNLRYVTTAGLRAQSAGAVAVGIERPGADKLAPIWLDTPARMHERLGFRPHATVVRS